MLARAGGLLEPLKPGQCLVIVSKTCDEGSNPPFNLGPTNIVVENLYFKARDDTSVTAAAIAATSTSAYVLNCTFETAGTDLYSVISANSANMYFGGVLLVAQCSDVPCRSRNFRGFCSLVNKVKSLPVYRQNGQSIVCSELTRRVA
jgi:hypothetical protein